MDLQQKIRTLPTQPGVYLYKNAEGQVIYVGKANSLRARVRSYFLDAAAADAKTGSLMREAIDIDYIVVDTPPLVPVPDCRLLARWVDGLLMVVAAHRTPRKLVEEGLNLVDPAKTIGVVFNGERRSRSGYYGYYHAYYSSADDRGVGWWRRMLTRGRTGDRRPRL